MQRSHTLPEPTAEEEELLAASETSDMQRALTATPEHAVPTLPSLKLPAEDLRLFDRSPGFINEIDLSGLVRTRRLHETARARESVRRQGTPGQLGNTGSNSGTPPPVQATTESSRSQILSDMRAILRGIGEYTAHGVGTGLERKARISGSTTIKLTGNSATAALAAGRRAATVRLNPVLTLK